MCRGRGAARAGLCAFGRDPRSTTPCALGIVWQVRVGVREGMTLLTFRGAAQGLCTRFLRTVEAGWGRCRLPLFGMGELCGQLAMVDRDLWLLCTFSGIAGAQGDDGAKGVQPSTTACGRGFRTCTETTRSNPTHPPPPRTTPSFESPSPPLPPQVAQHCTIDMLRSAAEGDAPAGTPRALLVDAAGRRSARGDPGLPRKCRFEDRGRGAARRLCNVPLPTSLWGDRRRAAVGGRCRARLLGPRGARAGDGLRTHVHFRGARPPKTPFDLHPPAPSVSRWAKPLRQTGSAHTDRDPKAAAPAQAHAMMCPRGAPRPPDPDLRSLRTPTGPCGGAQKDGGHGDGVGQTWGAEEATKAVGRRARPELSGGPPPDVLGPQPQDTAVGSGGRGFAGLDRSSQGQWCRSRAPSALTIRTALEAHPLGRGWRCHGIVCGGCFLPSDRVGGCPGRAGGSRVHSQRFPTTGSVRACAQGPRHWAVARPRPLRSTCCCLWGGEGGRGQGGGVTQGHWAQDQWTHPVRRHAPCSSQKSVFRFAWRRRSLEGALIQSGGWGGHLGCTETQRGRLWTACGQRCVDNKNSQTTPATTSTTPNTPTTGRH